MIKLEITQILDQEEKIQGILWADRSMDLIFFPKNTRIWSITLNRYYNLHTNEVLSPEGSHQLQTRDQALRLLTLIQGEEVVQETVAEMSERLVSEDPLCTTWNWVSDYFNRGESRFLLTKKAEAAVEELTKPAGSRYAKTTKGKLTQKKWRQSDGGKETLENRRTIRKEEKDNFKAAAKWIAANPGNTFEDWEDHCKKLSTENG